MTATAIAVFALAIVTYVALSRRLTHAFLSGPLVFTLIGIAMGLFLSEHSFAPAEVRALAESTLALILFHDAAQVRPRQIEKDAGLTSRLLLIGLPITILAGLGTALLLFPGVDVWLALFLAAATAPTDAGLGAATVLNPIVPTRIRRILNVESGLNDGLATPIVFFAIAALTESDVRVGHEALTALSEIGIGLLVGVVVGFVAGRSLRWTLERGLTDGKLLPIGVLALPLLTYYGTHALHGNGFVAAFVAGTTFAVSATRTPLEDAPADLAPLELTESVSTLLSYAVWTVFGTVIATRGANLFSWQAVVFAVLALTVLRMAPVALSLIGSGLKLPSVAFIGWFGPRGLATVIFALFGVEELPNSTHLQPVLGAMVLTALFSVVAHGLSADPGASTYGRWAARTQPTVEMQASIEPRRSRR